MAFCMLLRSALKKKKEDDEKDFGAIDYDAPVEAEKKTIGLGTQVKFSAVCAFLTCKMIWLTSSSTVYISLIQFWYDKIGVGVAVLVFGLVFALGDFLPSGRYGIVSERFFYPVPIFDQSSLLLFPLCLAVTTLSHLINLSFSFKK